MIQLLKYILVPVAFGGFGALMFLFLFPGGAISTLMHAVLKLPGPGVGFGVIYGPFMVFFAIIASEILRKRGAALISSVAFGAVMLAASVFKLNTAGHGNSIEFFISTVIFGLSIEAMLYILRNRSTLVKLVVSAVFADIVFLAYSLQFIFANSVPEKYAVLIAHPQNIVIIFSASAISAVIFALISLYLIKYLMKIINK